MSAVFWIRCLWAVGLVAVFFSGKFLYVTLYSLLIIFLLARYSTRRGFSSLSIKRTISASRVFRGEDIQVTLAINNPSWVPLVHIQVNDEVPLNLPAQSPHRAIFALAPQAGISFSYTVRTRKRGVYQFGPVEVQVSDPWGLAELQGRVENFSEMVVYPKVLMLEQLGLPSSLPFGEIRTKHRIFEDPARTIGVRPYQPGDPLKKMHWKASARTSALYVREYQPTIAVETSIFLNLSDSEFNVANIDYASEFAVEVAASLAYYLHNQRQSVGLVTNGRDGGPRATPQTNTIQIPARKGPEQIMRILETLARVEVHNGKGFAACLAEEARQLPWGSTVLVITPEDTPEIVDLLYSLRRAGYLVMVFLVGSRVLHPNLIGVPLLTGLTFYRVRHEGELQALSAVHLA